MGIEQVQSSFIDVEVTIPISTSTPATGVLNYGLTPVGIIFPAAMTGTALSFTTNDGSGTYVAVGSLAMDVAVGAFVPFASAWEGVQLGDDWKPVSGGTEAAARTLIVRCRAV